MSLIDRGTSPATAFAAPVRRRRKAVLAALASVVLLTAGTGLFTPPRAAHAQVRQGSDMGRTGLALPQRANANTELTPKARLQIASLLEAKKNQTPAQRKMASSLVWAVKMERKEAVARGMETVPIKVQRDLAGRIFVDMRVAEVTDALLATLRGAGAKIVYARVGTQSVRAWLPISSLEAVMGTNDNFQFVEPAVLARTKVGAVTSEGDRTHKAREARSLYGVNGSGIKIGVLSDSANGVSAAQDTGDLGLETTVLAGQTGDINGNDEGIAMMELIHDLAPGSPLFFATAANGLQSFADNIVALRAAGCDVIVDDIGYFNENPFGDDIASRAINQVTSQGALYFSAAGNNGNLVSGTSSVWEGDWADSGNDLLDPQNGASLGSTLRFSGTSDFNLFDAAALVYVFWSDPIDQVQNDYDLFLIDDTTGEVVGASTNGVGPGIPPYEAATGFSFDFQSPVRVYVVRNETNGIPAPRFFHISANGTPLAFATQGQIADHAAAAPGYGVAAVDVATAGQGPFVGGRFNPVESFSSDGPRRVFYKPDGSPYTPNNLLSTGGVVRIKPDIAAADGTNTTVPGFQPFFGTSAAAPHAAAIAALVKSRNPALTTAQMRSILEGASLDIQSPGIDNESGVGLLMADAAVAAATSGGVAYNIQSLTLNPATVVGGNPSTGTVTIAVPAPQGGVTLNLSSSNTTFATVPLTVTVPQGALSTSFTVTTTPVSSQKLARITATRGRSSAFATLTVNVPVVSPWSPSDIAINRTDNSSRLLWKKTDNTYAVWTLNPAGTVTGGKLYGPITNYAAKEIAVGPNGKTVVAWDSPTTRRLTLWVISANLSAIEKAFTYSYPAGYAPQSIAVDQTNNIRLLWTKTDNTLALWTINPNSNPAGVVTNNALYGPFTNLEGTAIAVGPDGKVRLLFRNFINNQATVWTLPSAYGRRESGYVYNVPTLGAVASDISVGADNNTRLQWRYTSGAITLMDLRTATGGNGAILGEKGYGPFNNAVPFGIATGSDNQTRALWANRNGSAIIVTVSDDVIRLLKTSTYGPIY